MKFRLIALPVLVFGAASCSHTQQQIESLLANSVDVTGLSMDYSQLHDLPEPVQRYFRYAVPEGHPHVRNVRLHHSGLFKRSRDVEWEEIRGDQYFSAARPGFMWIGTTSLFQAHDAYLNDAGSLRVYLFGRLRIVNETGPHMNQGEVLRWLGEAVWFPTALLPRDGDEPSRDGDELPTGGEEQPQGGSQPGYPGKLQWSPIDHNTARVDFTYNGISIWYVVTINNEGQITRLETERYMEEGRLERWEGRLSDYRRVNGVMVPMQIEASWLLPDYTHTYARFQIEILEHDV